MATVDTNGIVTAVNKGTAVITARTLDGNFTVAANVDVRIPATSVVVTPSEITLQKGNQVLWQQPYRQMIQILKQSTGVQAMTKLFL